MCCCVARPACARKHCSRQAAISPHLPTSCIPCLHTKLRQSHVQVLAFYILSASGQAAAEAAPCSQTVDGSAKGSAEVLLGAVKWDSVTGDHVAEAGALSLAGQGLCCIQHLEKLAAHHAVSCSSVLLP